LLKATSALKIVAAPSHWDAANEAIALVKEQGVELDCEVVPIAPKTAWDKNDSPKLYVRALTPEQEGPLPAFIVHSSGSTGFPKVSGMTD
jgi:acyl-coenzyme A synthetase/AMP-(fatty) acid ligase